MSGFLTLLRVKCVLKVVCIYNILRGKFIMFFFRFLRRNIIFNIYKGFDRINSYPSDIDNEAFKLKIEK